MTGLDRVRDTVRAIAACLETSDWDTLAAIDHAVPSDPIDGASTESLTEALREVEVLQHRIEVAMGAIRDELGEVPRMRKAARAYTPLS